MENQQIWNPLAYCGEAGDEASAGPERAHNGRLRGVYPCCSSHSHALSRSVRVFMAWATMVSTGTGSGMIGGERT